MVTDTCQHPLLGTSAGKQGCYRAWPAIKAPHAHSRPWASGEQQHWEGAGLGGVGGKAAWEALTSCLSITENYTV